METLQQLNKVELIGICGNIRIQEFSGKKVARITLATNYCYKSSQGEVIVETCWHSVSAWESSKVKDLESISKGTRLHIVGRLKNQRYTSADGTDHSCVEIIASSLEILEENLLMEE